MSTTRFPGMLVEHASDMSSHVVQSLSTLSAHDQASSGENMPETPLSDWPTYLKKLSSCLTTSFSFAFLRDSFPS